MEERAKYNEIKTDYQTKINEWKKTEKESKEVCEIVINDTLIIFYYLTVGALHILQ